jgi:hypothetical protein
MSRIQIDNITIANPKASLTDSIGFDITFTAVEELQHALVWKIVYVGSAFNEDHDQILEDF